MPVDPTLDVEHQLFSSGATHIIGVDEVGRGAIAGPVMVGVCVITAAHREFPTGLRDSKLVSEKKRTQLFPEVHNWAQTAVGECSAQEIEQWGITTSLGTAAKRALILLHEQGVDVAGAVILLDGSHDWLSPVLSHPLTVITRVKADQDCAVVAAASIVAKVTRDALMTDLHEQFPHYGWESNKGYGSVSHLNAVKQHGVSDYHRTSWVKVTPATP